LAVLISARWMVLCFTGKQVNTSLGLLVLTK
jgi:hypothetical protein